MNPMAFGAQCAYVFIISLLLPPTICYVNYDVFKGFDVKLEDILEDYTLKMSDATPTVVATTNATTIATNATAGNSTGDMNDNEQTATTVSTTPFICPEEEKPSNIGPYEVPTQRDLVMLIKKALLKKFEKYHKKTLLFLRDIKDVARSTVEKENQCPPIDRIIYRKCVKRVNNEWEHITKTLVTVLEDRRHKVDALTESTICNTASMDADPLQLLKTLVIEEVSLQFALPNYLRLLNTCSMYCKSMSSSRIAPTPRVNFRESFFRILS